MGRDIKNSHNLPRVIDIDILTFNDMIIDSADLEIPHPRISERKFIIKPWMEIAPEYILPKKCISVKTLYSISIEKNKYQAEILTKPLNQKDYKNS